jgi:hypothetical protein
MPEPKPNAGLAIGLAKAESGKVWRIRFPCPIPARPKHGAGGQDEHPAIKTDPFLNQGLGRGRPLRHVSPKKKIGADTLFAVEHPP